MSGAMTRSVPRPIPPLVKLALEVGPIAIFFLAYRLAPVAPDERRRMVTTLVVPRSQDEVEREVWEIATGSEPHIDFVTDDLAAFLEGVVTR